MTVVLPTRERAEVLVHALRTVTAQDYDNLEILVSDNASGDSTRDVVSAAGDPRVRYINTGRRVSMTDNWEFALRHVTGEWVTIIGDDDGLMPRAISTLAGIVRATGARAIRSRVCKYAWPSRTRQPFGRLTVPLGRGHEVRQSKRWLERVMRGLCTYAELPILYTGGFIHRSVLDSLRRGDRVYQSCIPDVYSAIAICSVLDSFVFAHEPLAVSGASAHSTGASLFSAGPAPQATPGALFRAEETIPMHAAIPRDAHGSYPRAVQALVYECYLQSAFLRADETVDRHAEQLEITLAYAQGKQASAVLGWGKLFAEAHGLDFEEIAARAARTRAKLMLTTLPSRIGTAVRRYDAGSPLTPVVDVFEASLCAAAIRDRNPGLLARVRGAVEHAVRRRRELRAS